MFQSFVSSVVALVFTYPIDLALTRKSGKLIPDGNYETYRSCFHTKIDTMINYNIPINKMIEEQKNKNQILFSKYYEGFAYALLLSSVNLFTNMIGFAFIKDKLSNNREENKKYSLTNFLKLLGYTTALSILTSPFIYPFDTILRIIQVNGGRGFLNKIDSGRELTSDIIIKRNLKPYYRYLFNFFSWKFFINNYSNF